MAVFSALPLGRAASLRSPRSFEWLLLVGFDLLLNTSTLPFPIGRSIEMADTNNCFCCCAAEVGAPQGAPVCPHGRSCSEFCNGQGFSNVFSCSNEILKAFEPEVQGPLRSFSIAVLANLIFTKGQLASESKQADLERVLLALARSSVGNTASFAVAVDRWAAIPRRYDGRAAAVVHFQVSCGAASDALAFLRAIKEAVDSGSLAETLEKSPVGAQDINLLEDIRATLVLDMMVLSISEKANQGELWLGAPDAMTITHTCRQTHTHTTQIRTQTRKLAHARRNTQAHARAHTQAHT